MQVVTGTLGRPIQGISQQPNNVRIDGQCNESVNMSPDLVKGLTTRTGFYEIAKMNIKIDVLDKVHYYKRSEGEEYFIIVSHDKAEGLKVVDPKGNEYNVVADAEALEYLYRNDANVRDLEFKTVGDFTFISNKSVEVKQSPFKSEKLRNEAVIYCQYIDYSQTHSVYAGDTLLAEYTSMDGTDSTNPKQKESVRTSAVIDSLVASINGGQGGEIKEQSTAASRHAVASGYYILRAPSGVTGDIVITKVKNNTTGKYITWDNYDGKFIIWNQVPNKDVKEGDALVFSYYFKGSGTTVATDFIATKSDDANSFVLRRKDGKDFEVRTADDADGKNLITVKGHLNDPSMLPNEAPIGMKVQIYPKGAKPEETYWLEATQPIANASVVWKECIAPEQVLGLDNTTMPISLIREFDGGNKVFKLKLNDWGVREVGDEMNNTDPSFVGGKIASIGLFQNRLFFTSGESISMSRSSDFFQFYKTTTQTVVATDPYDAYSDTEDVIDLSASIGFDGDLILFSESSQHSISGESIITPENPTPIRKLTAFDVQLTSKPVSSGENIFFAFDYGKYSGVREFFTDSIADTKRARPITDHVNQLIEGRIRTMKSSSSLNKLICQGSNLTKLYVYDWLWQGNEKVQSAWGEWDFNGDTILHYELVDSFMHMLVSRGGVIYMLSADLGDPPEGFGMDFPVRLDNKKIVSATLDEATNKWIIPNHLQNLPISQVVAVAGEGFYKEDVGTQVNLNEEFPLSFDNLNIAPEGVKKVSVVLGTPFKARYSPSNPYPRDQDGSPRSDLDRLQMGNIIYNYDMAGPCTGQLTMLGYKTFEYPLTPRVMGSNYNLVGFATLASGTFSMPVRTKSTRYKATIETSSHIPLRIREVEYQATYQRK